MHQFIAEKRNLALSQSANLTPVTDLQSIHAMQYHVQQEIIQFMPNNHIGINHLYSCRKERQQIAFAAKRLQRRRIHVIIFALQFLLQIIRQRITVNLANQREILHTAIITVSCCYILVSIRVIHANGIINHRGNACNLVLLFVVQHSLKRQRQHFEVRRRVVRREQFDLVGSIQLQFHLTPRHNARRFLVRQTQPTWTHDLFV
mmetsp:Transcript_4501/g.7704  ORF Transcript_4501/g.7704 Transcript_4501/m.7704 type:complete len:204 (-) Transcript_4501:1564-2175(-)